MEYSVSFSNDIVFTQHGSSHYTHTWISTAFFSFHFMHNYMCTEVIHLGGLKNLYQAPALDVTYDNLNRLKWGA